MMALAATVAELGGEPLIPAVREVSAVPERRRRKKGLSSQELWAEEARKATKKAG